MTSRIVAIFAISFLISACSASNKATKMQGTEYTAEKVELYGYGVGTGSAVKLCV